MIIILIIIASFSRFKKKIPSQHFKNHACARPNICTGVIRIAYYCFRGSVLPCLNRWSEMVMRPASVAHVNNRHMAIIGQFRSSFRLLGGLLYLFFWFCRRLNGWFFIFILFTRCLCFKQLLSNLLIQFVFFKLGKRIIIRGKSSALNILSFLFPSLFLCLLILLLFKFFLIWGQKERRRLWIFSRNESLVISSRDCSFFLFVAFSKSFCICKTPIAVNLFELFFC